MKIKIVFLLLIVPLFALAKGAHIDEQSLFDSLDAHIARRALYTEKKEIKLKRLKRELSNTANKHTQLKMLDQIYREYYTYRYDSAMVYAKRGFELAEQLKDNYYITLNRINRAAVLSTGGFYSQAEDLLQKMSPEKLPAELLQYYYYTLTWVYNYWAAFCSHSEFEEDFVNKKRENLTKTIAYVSNKNSAFYYYLCGELEYLQHRTNKAVLTYYQKALNLSPIDTRVHASAAYCMARYYKDYDEMDLYEKYIVEAAISDLVCPLKENLAMQELSTYLYNKDTKYAERAAKYINCSMEDAQFYNNRLRMVEISHILPVITATNHKREVSQNRIIKASLLVVSIISLGFLALAIFAFKQNRRLAKSRHEVKSQNALLEELNTKLLNTNKRRETYMRLFMDISAVYIKKLDDYRKLVSRKIKAKQTADLLTTINSYKLAEEEAGNFYIRFDKAFMELYPNFVTEFNKLLLPDKQITLPSPNSLPKEVRIYALMRLGVTDGQELATLLFYSTQTIYNYKSAMRRRAANTETFESDINKLCHVI